MKKIVNKSAHILLKRERDKYGVSVRMKISEKW